jgi:hypothetical protein
MKTIFRVAIIIAAALVVAGVTYAIGSNEWSTERVPNTFSHGALGGFGHPEGRGIGARHGFHQSGGGRGADPFSAASLLAFAQTLIPIALVITVVTLATKGIRAIRRQRTNLAVGQV